MTELEKAVRMILFTPKPAMTTSVRGEKTTLSRQAREMISSALGMAQTPQRAASVGTGFMLAAIEIPIYSYLTGILIVQEVGAYAIKFCSLTVVRM